MQTIWCFPSHMTSNVMSYESDSWARSCNHTSSSRGRFINRHTWLLKQSQLKLTSDERQKTVLFVISLSLSQVSRRSRDDFFHFFMLQCYDLFAFSGNYWFVFIFTFASARLFLLMFKATRAALRQVVDDGEKNVSSKHFLRTFETFRGCA